MFLSKHRLVPSSPFQPTRSCTTYRLTADIGVPNLCIELHHRCIERILIRNLNVDRVGSPRVRRIGRSGKSALQMPHGSFGGGSSNNTRAVMILLDVGKL